MGGGASKALATVKGASSDDLNKAVGSLSHAERKRLMAALAKPSSFNLDDPDDVFLSCDTDLSGRLDEFETRFALQAFGVFLSKEEAKEQLGEEGALTQEGFRGLVEKMQGDKSTGDRRPRAVPYSKRGLSLGQLQKLEEATLDSGYLGGECDKFNEKHAAQISCGKKFTMGLNLYAMNTFFVTPVTAVGSADVPEEVRTKAGTPEAARESSYAELVNPAGVDVNFFISHFWGHEFRSTMKALRNHASSVCRGAEAISGRDLLEYVYWVCVFALNQHRPGEEVGSSPEEGPFNAALAKATNGAIMILDQDVQPFSRIWCLFEVHKMSKLNFELVLVSEDGPLNIPDEVVRTSVAKMAEEACNSIVSVSAFKANASCEDDLYAIWYRIGSWDGWSFEGMKGVAKDNPHLASSFEEFDVRVGQLLATPVLRSSLQAENVEQSVRCLGLGAVCDVKVLAQLEKLGVDLKTAKTPVSKFDAGGEKDLVSVMAFFGQHDALRCLLERGAPASTGDKDGRRPLHQAARQGHLEAVKILLEFGAEIDEKDECQWQPIHEAAQSGSLDIVKLFVEKGADVNCADSDNRTPLSCCVEAGQREMAEHLIDHGADLSAGCNGSCLHDAAMAFRPECTELLIARGAGEDTIKEVKEVMSGVLTEELDEAAQARCRKVKDILDKA